MEASREGRRAGMDPRPLGRSRQAQANSPWREQRWRTADSADALGGRGSTARLDGTPEARPGRRADAGDGRAGNRLAGSLPGALIPALPGRPPSVIRSILRQGKQLLRQVRPEGKAEERQAAGQDDSRSSQRPVIHAHASPHLDQTAPRTAGGQPGGSECWTRDPRSSPSLASVIGENVQAVDRKVFAGLEVFGGARHRDRNREGREAENSDGAEMHGGGAVPLGRSQDDAERPDDVRYSRGVTPECCLNDRSK